jgi:hypothetical protein
MTQTRSQSYPNPEPSWVDLTRAIPYAHILGPIERDRRCPLAPSCRVLPELHLAPLRDVQSNLVFFTRPSIGGSGYETIADPDPVIETGTTIGFADPDPVIQTASATTIGFADPDPVIQTATTTTIGFADPDPVIETGGYYY